MCVCVCVCMLPVWTHFTLQVVGGFHNNWKPPEGLLAGATVSFINIPKVALSYWIWNSTSYFLNLLLISRCSFGKIKQIKQETYFPNQNMQISGRRWVEFWNMKWIKHVPGRVILHEFALDSCNALWVEVILVAIRWWCLWMNEWYNKGKWCSGAVFRLWI